MNSLSDNHFVCLWYYMLSFGDKAVSDCSFFVQTYECSFFLVEIEFLLLNWKKFGTFYISDMFLT